MPAKPIITYAFATDANFAAGPAAGNPTTAAPLAPNQGLVPGNEFPTENVNYLFNVTGDWTSWLLAGTPTAVADTTIVEREASGNVNLIGLTLGGFAAGVQPLQVTSDTGALDTAIITHNNLTGSALTMSAGSSEPTLYTASGGAGAAIRAEADQPGAYAAEFAGLVDANALLTSFDDLSGTGYIADTPSGATDAAEAIAVIGRDDAKGINVVVASGVGMQILSTGGTRAELRLNGFASDPGLGVSQPGDIYYNTATDQLSVRDGATFRRVWTSDNGRAYAIGTNPNQLVGFSAPPLVVATANLTNAGTGGFVTITVSYDLARQLANGTEVDEFEWDIFDNTAAAIVAGPFRAPVPAATVGDLAMRNVTAKILYSPGAATAELQLRCTRDALAPSNYRVTNASIEASGMHP